MARPAGRAAQGSGGSTGATTCCGCATRWGCRWTTASSWSHRRRTARSAARAPALVARRGTRVGAQGRDGPGPGRKRGAALAGVPLVAPRRPARGRTRVPFRGRDRLRVPARPARRRAGRRGHPRSTTQPVRWKPARASPPVRPPPLPAAGEQEQVDVLRRLLPRLRIAGRCPQVALLHLHLRRAGAAAAGRSVRRCDAHAGLRAAPGHAVDRRGGRSRGRARAHGAGRETLRCGRLRHRLRRGPAGAAGAGPLRRRDRHLGEPCDAAAGAAHPEAARFPYLGSGFELRPRGQAHAPPWPTCTCSTGAAP